MREGDHLGEVREEGLGVVVPEFHVWVVEEAFEDCAGDVCRLIALVWSGHVALEAKKGKVTWPYRSLGKER